MAGISKIFSGLDPEITEVLLEKLIPRDFEESETVFSEGDPADALFLIEEGEVSISREGQILGVLGPGEILGELALFEQATRSATARCHSSNCHLKALSAAEFETVLSSCADSGAAIYRQMLSSCFRRLSTMNRYFVSTVRAGTLASQPSPLSETAPELLSILVQQIPSVHFAALLISNPHTADLEVSFEVGLPPEMIPEEGILADDPIVTALSRSVDPHEQKIGDHFGFFFPINPDRTLLGSLLLGSSLSSQAAPLRREDRLLAETISRLLTLTFQRHLRQEEEANRERLERSRGSGY